MIISELRKDLSTFIVFFHNTLTGKIHEFRYSSSKGSKKVVEMEAVRYAQSQGLQGFVTKIWEVHEGGLGNDTPIEKHLRS